MLDTETEQAPPPTRRRPWRRIALGGAVLVAVVVAAVVWFFSGDAPDEADLGETAAAVTAPSTTAGEAPAATATGIEELDRRYLARRLQRHREHHRDLRRASGSRRS